MEGSPKSSKSRSSVPRELGLFIKFKTGDAKKGNELLVFCDAKNTDDTLRIDQVEAGEAEGQENKIPISSELTLGNADSVCRNRKSSEYEVGEISLELTLGNADSIRRNRETSECSAELCPSATCGAKRMKGHCHEAGEEGSHDDVVSDLKLYLDPWVIKKRIETSDTGNMARLLLSKDMVKKHILPLWDAERIENIKNGEGVSVWDWDTKSEHQVVFKQWTSGCYVLKAGWTKEFVKRRELNKGDEVGLYWDRSNSRFNFSILKRGPKD